MMWDIYDTVGQANPTQAFAPSKQQPQWQAYCLHCGEIALSSCGDDMEQLAKAHKKANPSHSVMIASEILEGEA